MVNFVNLKDDFMNRVEISYISTSEQFIISLRRTECGIDSYMSCCINKEELKNTIRMLEDEGC